MIKKYSSKNEMADVIVSEMNKTLTHGVFSFAELTTMLVKCAEQLEAQNDTLVTNVDDILTFIQDEILE